MFQSKISNNTAKIYQIICKRVTIILVSLLCLSLVVSFVGLYCLSINLLESQAMQYAMVSVKTLNEARRLYSKNVIERLKPIDGITIAPEYHSIGGGIPNPATYTIELGDSLSDESQGLLFRLYSEYPFPNRQKTGGPQDRFQHDALNYLKKHPQDSFYRKEKLGDILVFRYTQGILMEPSCLACHNKLPNSPKKDWKVGELRGVVEITQPLDKLMLIANNGLKAIYLALTIVIFLAISGLVLVILRFRTINRELEEKVMERTIELYRLANFDGLTQLANRRQFDRILEQEWQRSRSTKQPVSLILCDVDYFKQYNDTYGHQAGDDCLRAVAEVLQLNLTSPGAVAARYGGEEFAIILPKVDMAKAIQVATGIRTSIHQCKIPHKTSLTQSYITLSMGIATMISKHNNSREQLIKFADDALYKAKHEGRDRFIVCKELPSRLNH